MRVSGLCTLAILPSGALSGYVVEDAASGRAVSAARGETAEASGDEGGVDAGEGAGRRRYLGVFGRPVPRTSERDCWQEDDDFQLYRLTFVDFATRDEASVFAIKTNYDACRLRLADQEGDGTPASAPAAPCEGLTFETHTLLAGDAAERLIRQRFPPRTCAKLAERDAIVTIGPASVWGLTLRQDRVRELEREAWGCKGTPKAAVGPSGAGRRRTQTHALGPAVDMGEWGPGDAGVFADWSDADTDADADDAEDARHALRAQPPQRAAEPLRSARVQTGTRPLRDNLPDNAGSTWIRSKRRRASSPTPCAPQAMPEVPSRPDTSPSRPPPAPLSQ